MYHRSRERHCRAMAGLANDPDVRRSHEELASLHAGRAAALRPSARRRALRRELSGCNPGRTRTACRTHGRRTPRVQAFFDEATNSVSYLVARSGRPGRRRSSTRCSVSTGERARSTTRRPKDPRRPERAACRSYGSLETHAHADHLSAAAIMKRERRARRLARRRRNSPKVQKVFGPNSALTN